jgi:small-conductance mechanosensitive channel
VSLLLAWALSRYGRRQEFARASGDHGALARFRHGQPEARRFPLLALLLVLIVRKLFRYWQLGPVSLLRSGGAIAALDGAGAGGDLRAAPRLLASSWLATSERFIATSIWFCLALYLTGLAEPLIEMLEQVSFHVGKQKLDLWTLLNGLVTVVATVLVALWLSGVIESSPARQRHAGLQSARGAGPPGQGRAVGGRLVAEPVDRRHRHHRAVGVQWCTRRRSRTRTAENRQQLRQWLHHSARPLDSHRQPGRLDATTSGVVTQITARYTVLRTLAGTEVIIPNEYLVSNIVRNESFTDSRLRVVVPVQVAYGTDLEQAMRLMTEAAQAQPRVLAEPAPQALLTLFADSGINLELGFWIADPQEGTGGVRSAINLSIWRSFREHGIEIPFPQREVRLIGVVRLRGDRASGGLA